MVQFLPFHPDHLRAIDIQGAQHEAHRLISAPGTIEAVRSGGFALTALAPTDDPTILRVIGCAGMIHQWQGRALVWALIGAVRPVEWPALVRRMRDAIEAAHRTGVRRIEATADAEFPPGCRLLEMLGFDEPRHLVRAYSPDGRDHFLYARVRR